MANAYLDQLFGLAGQVAVVTGGTGVLGGAVRGDCPRRGRGRRRRPQCRARRGAGCAIVAAGGQASFAPVEVSARSSVEALLQSVLARYGRVDMSINGAGVNSASAYLDVQDQDWDRVLANNLTGVHLGCQIFGRQMIASGQGERF